MPHESDDAVTAANVASIGRAIRAKAIYLAVQNAVSGQSCATKYWGWSEARGVLEDIEPDAVDALYRVGVDSQSSSAGGGGSVFVRHIPGEPGRGAAFVVISWDDAASGDEDALPFVELLSRMVLDSMRTDPLAPGKVSSLIEECRLPVLCVARDVLTHMNTPAVDVFGGRDVPELMDGSLEHVTRLGHRETGPGYRPESATVEPLSLRSDPGLSRIYSVPLLLDGVPYVISAIVSQDEADQRRLVDALEQQRQHIGLELHDGLGQLLTAARIASYGIAEAAGAPYRDQCEWLTSVVDEALALLRGVTDELSPAPLLRGEGIVKALEGLAEVTRRLGGVTCTLACGGEIEIDDPDRRVHVYRIVQEAVNNSVKHALANTINISVWQSDEKGEVRISVMDDGVGLRDRSKTASTGMESMRYRAARIGASLSIRSLPSQHTIVRLSVPI